MNQSKGFLYIYIIVFILTLIVAAGGSYYVYTKVNKPKVNQSVEQQPSNEQNMQQFINQENKIENKSVTSTPKNCGGDINCLINAVKNDCQLAKVNHTVTTLDPGYVFIAVLVNDDTFADLGTVTTNSYYEIKGKEGNNCIIYEKFLGGSVKRNQDKINQLVTSGKATAEEAARGVAEVESATLEGFRRITGRDATCKVTAQEFQAKIDKVLSGNVSLKASIDFNSGKAINEDPYAQRCTGRLYDLNQ